MNLFENIYRSIKILNVMIINYFYSGLLFLIKFKFVELIAIAMYYYYNYNFLF